MGNLYAYSAVTTKIRAMQRYLISESEFRRMALCRNVTEAANFLKKFPPYANLFGDKNPEELHREDLERLLNANQYGDFAKIFRFSNMQQRKCMNLYFLHYEMDFIKGCLRNCMSGKAPESVSPYSLAYFRKHGKLDFKKIAAANSIESLTEALSGTPYGELFRKTLAREHAVLFDYEERLDLFYFKRLWEEKDRLLAGEERKALTDCFGARLDLLNLQWIYRSIKYYSLPPADIYSLLIPINYRLKPEEIKSLVESENEGEFRNRLDNTWYGKMGRKFFGESPDLEKLYSAIIEKIYSISAREDPYSFATVNTYLHRKEKEIHRIITLIESIRYSLPASDILSEIMEQNTGGLSND
jgi:V/A-type H+-transporting ATPase subunit C